MTEPIDEAAAARHRAKMEKRKSVQDAEVAGKTVEKGLLIVHTGTGKGKSTAAWGMVMRCLGHGLGVGVVQFVKGRRETGERAFLKRFPDLVKVAVMGEGFTWETQDRARDVAAASAAWEKAKELIRDESNSMVLLDEINIALRYDYLDINEVVAFLKSEKPHMTHVVLTGRNAKEELIEIADLVTEMELVKHPFRSGIKGQPGVEF
jgi:cob(I)alamin adenosyltransferase